MIMQPTPRTWRKDNPTQILRYPSMGKFLLPLLVPLNLIKYIGKDGWCFSTCPSLNFYLIVLVIL